ncbi:MAG TPA: hypothetical protein EYQ82_04600 [Dehalococcoidia bacterium]|nr:hypothetical protein [Dehalococcoidia bacterium]
MTGQDGTDQPFESTFGGVGGHTSTSSARASRSSVSSKSSSTSSTSSGSSVSSGSWAAASRTSSLPVTTSAIRRVRYSLSSSTSREMRVMAVSMSVVTWSRCSTPTRCAWSAAPRRVPAAGRWTTAR